MYEKNYYDNGQLYYQIVFGKDGLSKNEAKYYHETGKLSMIGSWSKGKREGVWKTYHENGQLKSIGEYIGFVPTGLWKYYDESGELIRTDEK